MSDPNFWDNIGGPKNPNPSDGELSFTLFGYKPSVAFAVIGLVSFVLMAIFHLWYIIKRKGSHRTFHILMLLSESAGYAARIHAHFNLFQIGNYSAQFLLLILAPILYTAAIDMTLNLVVQDYPGSECILLFRPRLVLIIFVTSDVVCILVQLAGGALFGVTAGQDPGEGGISPDTATNVLMAGLILQLVAWVIFIAFLAVAVYRAYQYSKYPHLRHPRFDSMRALLWTLSVVTLLIFWRACFRTAESASGYIASPLSREELFGTNDFLPVILAVLIFTIAPPFRFSRPSFLNNHNSHAVDPIGREETLNVQQGAGDPTASEKNRGNV